MPSPAAPIRRHLTAWAAARGIAVDASGYTRALDDNLFVPLSDAARQEFAAGDGGELGGPGKRGKMQALHSSSALACNAFDCWRDRDTASLAAALGLRSPIAGIEFERKFPTGLAGNPPNLDVVLTLEDGSICAIESKFLEPYGGRHAGGFKPKYFESRPGLWETLGYPACQDLAARIDSGEVACRWLHAEQLLKHLLGVARRGGAWELLYLWYRVPGPAGEEHATEVEDFAAVMRRDGVPFRAVTYQSLIEGVAAQGRPSDRDWVEYMTGRYLVAAG